MIQEAATYVLKNLSFSVGNETGQTAENPVGPSKQQLSRLSFTRQVCQESMDRHNSLGELTDVCLPIFVLETKQESS